MKILLRVLEDVKFVFLCLLMLINLIYMHYEVYVTNYIKKDVITPLLAGELDEMLYRPLLFCVIDVLAVVLLVSLLTWGRKRLGLTIAYVFFICIVLANVIYSRFFSQYITFDALCEASNFTGTWWFSYWRDMFRSSDWILALTTALSAIVIWSFRKRYLVDDVLICVCLFGLSCKYYCDMLPEDVAEEQNYGWGSDELINPFRYEQEVTVFNNGILRGQLYCNYISHYQDVSLSDSEMKMIDNYVSSKNVDMLPLPDTCVARQSPNVVFILVESLISDALNAKVGGEEVTPCINRLVSEEGAFCNKNMASQRGAGQSSDAQVSYLTGLVPLASEMSIFCVIRDSIVGLPWLMKNNLGYETYITLPTPTYFWHQNEANARYGISNVLKCVNEFNPGWANDEEVFRFLPDFKLEKPFFNLVITTTMHGPYTFDYLGIYDEKSPLVYPDDFPEKFRHYYDRCNYTDRQIGKYIDYLKQSGNYDNTMIVIASDHPADGLPDMENAPMPLVIANSGVPADMFEAGSINQIDLFPTMLDLLGIDSRWRGAGCSLLRDTYSPSVTPDDIEVSSKILRGNYFAR